MVEKKASDTSPNDDILNFADRFRTYSRSGPRPTDPSKHSDNGLGDVLDTLNSEHRYLAALLDTLENQTARLKPGKVPDYHLLLDIIDYLTHYPGQYHHPREDLLFTTMLQRDDAFRPVLERLEREHRTLEAYHHDLFAELTGIATGRAVDRPVLQRSLENYIAAYRQHMDYESRQVFPLAKGTLSAAERKKLGEKTRYIDDPLFGGDLQYRYRRLGRSLQTRAEVASRELASREFSAIQSTIEKLSTAGDTVTRLRTAIARRGRQSWREQKEAIRDHTQRGHGANMLFLPLTLLKNQGRHWRTGIAELRRILRGGDDGNSTR